MTSSESTRRAALSEHQRRCWSCEFAAGGRIAQMRLHQHTRLSRHRRSVHSYSVQRHPARHKHRQICSLPLGSHSPARKTQFCTRQFVFARNRGLTRGFYTRYNRCESVCTHTDRPRPTQTPPLRVWYLSKAENLSYMYTNLYSYTGTLIQVHTSY